jgi:hypothetical protein
MNRPSGVSVITFSAACAAMLLVLGSGAFFVVGVLVVTGDEGRAPVSVAITGMALAGAFALLMLALASAWLALNAVEVRDWARTLSLTEIAANTRERLRGAFSATESLSRSRFAAVAPSHKSRGLEHHPWRRI